MSISIRASVRRHLAVLAAILSAAVAAARDTVSLDAGWRFCLGDVPSGEAADTDVGSWSVVDIPHDWSILLPKDPKASTLGGGGYIPGGIGWYRKTFTAPETWARQRVLLEFDGVYMSADVWINGTHLDTHPYGYTGFRYDVTPHVIFGGENVVAVRVDNSAQPNSRWYSGSGIYRHVRLVVASPVHIAPHGVVVATAQASASSADLQAEVAVINQGESAASFQVEVSVFDPGGFAVGSAGEQGAAEVGATWTGSPPITIPNPQLWSPETPRLYRAVTVVRADGREVDRVETTFGIRTVRVSAERGFELNGRTLKLVGGNVHHDNGPLGAAAFDRAEQRRVELMKAAGFNAIRTSHNPPSPAFLDACDRLGMLVLEEAFDGWEKAKTARDYSVAFKEWALRDVDEMVRAGRNHPSVVMWSIGNEMHERSNANGLRIAKELSARVRELDTTRPVTAGVNGPWKEDWTKFDPLFATMDVAGYNYELRRHVEDHKRVPGRVILVTESYQSETFANWAVAQDASYVIGDFVWSGIDYLGEAGIGRVFPPGAPIVKHWEGEQFPWHGAACGDIDLTGWRKPVSHYRAIVWDRGERLYAAVQLPTPDGKPWGVSPWTVVPTLPSWTWPGQEGKDLTVEVYSRHEAVRLYLGDKRLGEKPTTRTEEFKATFVVPYAAGALRAVGVDGGNETETFVLQTAGAPVTVRLKADRGDLFARSGELGFVTVEIVDAAGGWNAASDRAVRYTVSGPATIAAIGNADLASFEGYQANPHRTHQGRALVVLRPTGELGEVTLAAAAEGLKPAKLSLTVRK